jgi:hypothetical protein
MTDRKQASKSIGELRVGVTAGRTPLVVKTLAVMARRLRERGIKLVDGEAELKSNGKVDVVLECCAGIGADGFAIARAADSALAAWRITGNDERGLLYGVGKFLRGCRRVAPRPPREGRVTPRPGLTHAGDDGAWIVIAESSRMEEDKLCNCRKYARGLSDSARSIRRGK